MSFQRKQHYLLHVILYPYRDVNKIGRNGESVCVVDVVQHWKVFEKKKYLSLHGYLDTIFVYCWHKNMAHCTS